MTRIALVVASVLAACATAVAGRVVEFPSGVTRLEKPIVLTPSDSGTVLRGASDDSTPLIDAIDPMIGSITLSGYGGHGLGKCFPGAKLEYELGPEPNERLFTRRP